MFGMKKLVLPLPSGSRQNSFIIVHFMRHVPVYVSDSAPGLNCDSPGSQENEIDRQTLLLRDLFILR